MLILIGKDQLFAIINKNTDFDTNRPIYSYNKKLKFIVFIKSIIKIEFSTY